MFDKMLFWFARLGLYTMLGMLIFGLFNGRLIPAFIAIISQGMFTPVFSGMFLLFIFAIAIMAMIFDIIELVKFIKNKLRAK